MPALLALLALIGMLSAPGTTVSAACPQQVSSPMHAMHHRSPSAPAGHNDMPCAACIAVIPTLPPIERLVSVPFAAFASLLLPLPGIESSLDPPPPRDA